MIFLSRLKMKRCADSSFYVKSFVDLKSLFASANEKRFLQHHHEYQLWCRRQVKPVRQTDRQG